MKTLVIFGVIILFILIGFLTFISSNPGNYISVPGYTHSYTKAFCDSENYCQDYEIFCNNDEIVRMAFTGAAVQFSTQWQDLRSQELRNKVC